MHLSAPHLTPTLSPPMGRRGSFAWVLEDSLSALLQGGEGWGEVGRAVKKVHPGILS
jgi:hypothetical protein